jgi:pimeloyl-ACP methyl ester carboxylesterase
MTAFVLVHGGWHGGWCWRFVAAALRRSGHDVYTPSLTGLGDRVHLARPGIDLELHIPGRSRCAGMEWKICVKSCSWVTATAAWL